MESFKSELAPQSKRVRVAREDEGVKISLDSHEAFLGWYTAASLSIPLHQVPLLEQALVRMRDRRLCGCQENKIISFPVSGL